jgi:hypothetical protein
MKKKFAKSLLLASIAVAISAPITAQELSLKDLNVQSSVAKKEAVEKKIKDEPTVVVSKKEGVDKIKESSQEPIEDISNKPKATSEVDMLDKLTTLANQGNLELQILTQQVERKKLEMQLKEDSFQKRLDSSMSALSIQFSEKEKEYNTQIASLQTELRRQRNMSSDALEMAENIKNESQKTENSVFVTNVIGIGRNLTASVYYEDKIIKVREGMSLGNDLSVKEIASNGVVFNDRDKEVFVALTNEEYAFSQTFNKQSTLTMEANSGGNQRVNYKR